MALKGREKTVNFLNATGLTTPYIIAMIAGLGLSLSAGVRAYLPLVALGIVSHIPSLHIQLRPGFDWIGYPVVIGFFAIMTVYEFSADKIPVMDHLNDVVHTFIRPVSGAVLFISTSNTLTAQGTAGVIIAGVIGAMLAGATHTAKAAIVRPASTVTTAGIANPFISLLEDIGTFIMILLTVLAPFVAGILIVVAIFFVVRGIQIIIKRRRNRNNPGAPTIATV